MRTTTGESPRAALPPIGLLLRGLDRLIDERFERTLGAPDVTRRQWQLLSTLAQRDATLEDLGAAVAPFLDEADGGSVEPHLAPLCRRGLVQRAGNTFRLTDRGRDAVAALTVEVRAIRRLVAEGISPARYEQALATLQQMIRNLEQG